MSDRADKLLREILAADDAFPAEGSFRRYEEAKANARAYLNEKPHEPLNSDSSSGLDSCSCERCKPNTMMRMRMIVCEICGNKRCPHATDHRNACTNSNEPGQPGSSYGPACPPHAAAEPEKPVAWMFERRYGRGVSFVKPHPFYNDDGVLVEPTPLYASPYAQPIARDEQDAKRYRWLKEPPHRWYISVMSDVQDRFPKFCVIGKDLDDAIDAALKSAGKEST